MNTASSAEECGYSVLLQCGCTKHPPQRWVRLLSENESAYRHVEKFHRCDRWEPSPISQITKLPIHPPIRNSLINQLGNQPSSQAAWKSNYQATKQPSNRYTNKLAANHELAHTHISTSEGGITGFPCKSWDYSQWTNSHQSSIHSGQWYLFNSLTAPLQHCLVNCFR